MGRLASIVCMDHRQPKEGLRRYAVATPGAVLRADLFADLQPLLSEFECVEVVTHTDCGFTRSQLGFGLDQDLTEEEVAQVEERTRIHRLDTLRRLIEDPVVRKSYQCGDLEIVSGHFDVSSRVTEWYGDSEVEQLLRELKAD